MKIMEIAEKLKKNNPEACGELSERKIAKLLRAGLIELKNHVDEVDEGRVKVPGFGTFVIKQVENKVTHVQNKRTLFNSAKKKVET